ncbi:MAG: phosphoribosylglycinamide formyltransferase [Bacteroidia bacterium]|nr:MAG: phosphoribosylglycinamide formyltransferase [Bacteroidia bacterium]
MHQIAVLASGFGSNAEKLMDYFQNHPQIRVAVVVSNNAAAHVLSKAKERGIPVEVLPGPAWEKREKVLAVFDSYHVSVIVLAGYMRLLPPYFVDTYRNRIINIHPALLPAFGGKGMYGMHVHRAVVESGAKKSGITIHLVNEQYDEGEILFSKYLEVLPEDTPESLAKRVQDLEHRYYAPVVEKYILSSLHT